MLHNKYIKAARHHKRVVLYRKLLLIAAFLNAIIFAALIAYPYILARLEKPHVINQELLNRMKKSSIMVTPDITGYHNGRLFYRINADETERKYRGGGIIYLRNLRGKFFLNDGSTLNFTTELGSFDVDTKLLVVDKPIHMQLVRSDDITYIELKDGYIDTAKNKIYTDKPVTITNKSIDIAADGFVATDQGEVITFSGHVVTKFKEPKQGVIHSDALDILHSKQQFVWRKNVVAEQNQNVVKCNKMVADYDKLTSQVRYINAYGNVRLMKGKDLAEGCHLSVDLKNNISSIGKCDNVKGSEQASVLLYDTKKF